jgi:glutamate-5-semialdehyde dehydrogenase
MPTRSVPFPIPDLSGYCVELARQARAAASILATASGAQKGRWLQTAAAALEERTPEIITANDRDQADAREAGLTQAQIDRLALTPTRVRSMAASLREVASLPDPVGQVRGGGVRPNGLEVLKIGVPLGVILFIYESRPNVTVDAAGLCVKSGNAILLRGGREAQHSNAALHRVLQDSLTVCDLPANAVQGVATPDRAAVGHLLQMPQYIDLVIPRGGEDLIRRVANEAQMPVLKHFKGNCHVYIEKSADADMAERIVINAKCQRPGVCNAAESLLIDAAVAEALLPRLATSLHSKGVELRGCPQTRKLIPFAKIATEDDYSAEYLDLIMSVMVVADIEGAVAHINRYGSHHTDAIVTRDRTAARRFVAAVDSAVVLVNASTRFNDGQELGLGAEIGISTDKFHARGPCGLLELTSYKYVVQGEGQIRE